jgi:type II secretion system protein D
MTRRKHAVWSSLAIALVWLLAASVAWANGHAKPGAQAARATGLAYTGGRGTPVGAPSRARFTLEFVDADIVDVFQALSTQSGVNIAVSGSVKGKTTLRLRNVTIEQAMNIVTRLNGLDYAWVEAAYVVGTPEEVRAMRVSELRSAVVVLQHISPEYAQQALSKLTPDVTVSTQKGVRSILLLGTESSLAKAERALAEMDVPAPPSPPTTEVVPVRYLKADQMAELISAAVPEVKVQLGPQENSLLITATDQQWQSVRSLISASDVAPAPAQATQVIYYVKYTSPTELQQTVMALVPDLLVTLAPRSFTPVVQRATGGAGGTAAMLAAPQYAGGGGGGGGGAGGGGGTAGVQVEAAPITALILSGAPYTVERGLKLIEQLDKAPKQVHITAMVTEINRDDVSRIGIDWGQSTGRSLGETGVPFIIGEPLENEIDPNTGKVKEPDVLVMRPLNVGRILRTDFQLDAVLRALEQKGRARILSNPSVTTLDGRQTSLHTGQTIYYQVAIAAATTGGIITDTRTIDVGVLLSVNPRVNENNEITMTISPTISSLVGTTAAQLPVVATRTVITTVRIKSGETAVLAGLVTDQEQVTIKKVPFLGNLPIAGELFKHVEKRPQHTEIMVFVTPTIVES